MLAECGGAVPADASYLVKDLRNLRQRLLRIADAVALSSDMTSEVLEDAAERDTAHREQRLALARQMRDDADLCRTFAQRLR